jgi:CRP/FNR family cyclic AMP-dependent transcriptional regulator
MTSLTSSHIEPHWLEPFLAHCHIKTYAIKVDFIRPGQAADTLRYLVEGSVAVVIDGKDNREMVLAYINKREFIGEMGLFVPQGTRNVTVRTRTVCKVAEITYQRLDRLLDTQLKDISKDFLYTLGSQLSHRLRSTSRKVEHLAFLDVTGRIAGALLDLCKQPDAMTHPDGMQIFITRQEIGRLVGCSREMAGRVLKNLEEQKLITVKGKTIVVLRSR